MYKDDNGISLPAAYICLNNAGIIILDISSMSDLLHKNSQCTIAASGFKGGTHSDDELIAVRREGPQ
jgi:hypothetical protein